MSTPTETPLAQFQKEASSSEPRMSPKGGIADLAKEYEKYAQKPIGTPLGEILPQSIEGEQKLTSEAADAIKPPEEGLDTASKTKSKSFTETLKSKAEEAEARAKRFEEEIKALREQELPKIQKELEEARSKVNDATTTKEYQEAMRQLEQLKQEQLEKESNWVTEQEKLRKELSFYNLETDPDFIRTVKSPRDNAKLRAERMLADRESVTAFNKALAANFAATTTNDPEVQRVQTQLRDEIFADIFAGLDDFKKGQFTNIVHGMVLPAEEAYITALANHEQTKHQIVERRTQQQRQAEFQNQKRWKDAYESTGSKISKEVEIPEEIGRIIVAKGIPVDTATDEAIAQATITDGGSKLPPEEVTRLINQGRVYRKNIAHIQGLNAYIAELKETIAKYQGSSTSSDTPSSSEPVKEELTPLQKYAKQMQEKGFVAR